MKQKGKRDSTILKEYFRQTNNFSAKKITAQSKSKTCEGISGMVT